MQKILITCPVPEETISEYRGEFNITMADSKMNDAQVAEVIGDYDGVLSVDVNFPPEMIDKCTKLKVIANFGVGYDRINTAYAAEKGIAVANTPTQVTEATAEHAAVLIFSVMRSIARYDREVRNHTWLSPLFSEQNTQIEGCVLGIVGFGRIGKRVCRKAQGMGMRVVYYDPFRAPEEAEKEYDVQFMELEELLKTADCVSVHIPYTKENHHLFNAEKFAMMKKSAYFVNAARGAVVDEAALIDALKNGEIKGAGLDVYEHEPHPSEELLTLENVVLTPHVASLTMKARLGMTREAMYGVVSVLRGETPYNLVNKPVK